MQLDVKMVEELNKKAVILNSERQRKLGALEAAKEAYERAVSAYKQKYGVVLDDTNLQEEYDAVFAQMQKEYTAQCALISNIESGKHGVVVEQVPVVNSVQDISEESFTPKGWGAVNEGVKGAFSVKNVRFGGK